MTVKRKNFVMKNILHHHIQTKQQRGHKYSIAMYVYVQSESKANKQHSKRFYTASCASIGSRIKHFEIVRIALIKVHI